MLHTHQDSRQVDEDVCEDVNIGEFEDAEMAEDNFKGSDDMDESGDFDNAEESDDSEYDSDYSESESDDSEDHDLATRKRLGRC